MATHNTIKWRHYSATLSNAELVIHLADLAEFVRFAEDHHIRSIYSFDADAPTGRFGMSHKGGLFIANAEGFKELNHYRDAMEQGFTDSLSYYEAAQKGFKTLDAYLLWKRSELNDPETYALLVKDGYQEGFETYLGMLSQELFPEEMKGIANAYDLYRKGTEAGFKNWFEMQAAMEKGFSTAHRYRSCVEFGLSDASEFEAAEQGKFVTAAEWKSAKEHGCTSRLEFRSMEDLDCMDAKGLKHDARVLLTLLARLPEMKEVSVDKLQQLLEKELALFQDPDTKMFRKWFTLQLRDRNNLLRFLRKQPLVKQFGSFHHDKEVFVTHSIKHRHVVIDGSNVAHNSHGNALSEPTVANLKLMVDHLQKHGFTDIYMIVDASLKHKIDDREALDAFAKTMKYRESQPNTSADLDIILYVKNHNCLLLSNDQFREWKLIDPWIQDNIASYRLTFMIKDNKVIIPELDMKN